MKKQECRRYVKSRLRIDVNDGLLQVKSVDHVVCTSVHIIAGRRTLVLHIARRENPHVPVYVVFQTKDDYITLELLANGCDQWRSASFQNLVAGCWYFTSKCACYKQEDTQRIERFCGETNKRGLDALTALQDRIMARRLKKRQINREQKTVERMRVVGTLPRDFKGWVHREVMPAYLIYRYGRQQRLPGQCTSCGHTVTVTGARHNKTGKCPHCRRSVKYVAYGRAGRMQDDGMVQVLQITGERELLVRLVYIWYVYRRDEIPSHGVWETARLFVKWDERGAITDVEPFYSLGTKQHLTEWKPGERPCFPYQSNATGSLCGHLYTRGLDGLLKDTPWQYSQLVSFYRATHKPLEVISFLEAYHRYPLLEYLIKLRLYAIAGDVIYHHGINHLDPHGKNIRAVLKVAPEDVPLLQEINADIGDLQLIQGLRRAGIPLDMPLLRWCQDQKVYRAGCITLPLGYTTVHKLKRYVSEQYEALCKVNQNYSGLRYESGASVLSEYADYLQMCRDMQYDLSNEFVLFPRNLMTAHDRMVERIRAFKKQLVSRQIANQYAALQEQYAFTHRGLLVTAPQTDAEIVAEGHDLHHCVGGYTERIASGECTVLFIRRSTEPDTPYFTMEIQGGRVRQVRGYRNESAPDDVNRFVSVWQRRKLDAVPVRRAA